MFSLPNWFKLLIDKEKLSLLYHGYDLKNINPSLIDLDLTNYCNRDCTGCHSASQRTQNKINISDQLFRQYLSAAEDAYCGINLAGGGEPTLHPQFNQYVLRIISAINDNKIPGCGIFTNGTMPRKLEQILLDGEDLIQNGRLWIRVSLNYFPVDPNLDALFHKYPKYMSISFLYHTEAERMLCEATRKIYESFVRSVRFRSIHDMSQCFPVGYAEKCLGRQLHNVIESTGEIAYCCLARGLHGAPPPVCPLSCPFGQMNIKELKNIAPLT